MDGVGQQRLDYDRRLEAIWHFCSNHEDLVKSSEQCGCFYCQKLFLPTEIKLWVNDESTAACPYCGIDSVLPETPLYDLNADLLQKMHRYWCGPELYSRTIDISGRRVAYSEVRPPRPQATLLLLHWLGGSRLGWTQVMHELGSTYRVLAPDLRDIGDSEQFAGDYLMEDLADDMAGFLQAVGGVGAVALGLSMGGMVAQHLAIRHPQLLRGLILVSTSPGGRDAAPSTERGRAALFRPVGQEAGERAADALALMAADGLRERNPAAFAFTAANARVHPFTPDTFKRQFNAIRRHDTVARLPSIGLPTLILHGEADEVLPLANAERLRAIPHSSFKAYPQTGHMPQLERPQQFLEDVRQFVDSLS